MENVGDFKYLSNGHSEDGSLTCEVEAKVKHGRKVSEVLRAVTGNRNVSRDQKTAISACCITSIMIVEMEYLRNACAVTWGKIC